MSISEAFVNERGRWRSAFFTPVDGQLVRSRLRLSPPPLNPTPGRRLLPGKERIRPSRSLLSTSPLWLQRQDLPNRAGGSMLPGWFRFRSITRTDVAALGSKHTKAIIVDLPRLG